MKALTSGSVAASLMLALGTVSAKGFGGPPFITDDPEPVDFHHYEFYIASYYFHGYYGTTGTLPHFEFNYGAAPNLQLHIIAPMQFAQGPGGPFQYGYGDTELGVKYRFVQESKNTPMVGVFPLVEAPSGNHNLGLGNGEAQIFLPVWAQKSFGNWTTYGGGGFWHNPGAGNRDYWWGGWEIQNQITKKLAIGGEVFHGTSLPTVDGSPQSGYNVGVMYDFDEGHHLLVSAGRGFQSDNVGTAYLAYQWTWGPHEKSEKPAASLRSGAFPGASALAGR